jgi:MFS family permease
MHASPARSSRDRGPIALLASMCLLYFFAYFQKMGVPGTIFNELQTDFGLSAGGVSTLAAVFLYVYGGMQIPAGLLIDRFGGARMLLSGGVLVVAGSLLFPLSPGLPLLYGARVLIGVGSSFIWLGILKEIAEMYPARDFAVMVGLVVFIGYSGGLVGTLPFERAADAWGWRGTLLGVAAATAAGFALFALVASRRLRVPAPPREPAARGSGGRRAASSLAPLGQVLANREGWPLLVSYPVQFALYFAVQGSIGKKMLQDAAGFTSAGAAAVTFAMAAISILCASTAGWVSRLAGERRRPLIVAGGASGFAACLGGFLALAFGARPAALVASFLLLAFSTIGATINTAAFKEHNARANAGTAVGVLNGCTYLLIGGLSNGAGWILDAFQAGAVRTSTAVIYPLAAYRTLFLVLMVLSLFSFLTGLRVRETGGRQAGEEAASAAAGR